MGCVGGVAWGMCVAWGVCGVGVCVAGVWGVCRCFYFLGGLGIG